MEGRERIQVAEQVNSLKRKHPEYWGPRLEALFLNGLSALMEGRRRDANLAGLLRILSDRDYRREVLENVENKGVINFWTHDFRAMPPEVCVLAVDKLREATRERS